LRAWIASGCNYYWETLALDLVDTILGSLLAAGFIIQPS